MHALICKLSILAALVAGPLLVASCEGQVNVLWDPSPNPTVAGYNLCWGTASGIYTFTNTYSGSTIYGTINNLAPGQTYFFAVQAFSGLGEFSPFSNEASLTVASPATNSAPSTGDSLAGDSSATNSAPSDGGNLPAGPSSTNSPPSDGASLTASPSATNSTGGLTASSSATNSGSLNEDSLTTNSPLSTLIGAAASVAIVAPAPPVIQPATPTGNSFTFTWNSTASQIYQIQYTTNLVQNVWANLGFPVVASGSTTTMSDPISSNSQMFYRACIIPP
jgi:hypothetical protein